MFNANICYYNNVNINHLINIIDQNLNNDRFVVLVFIKKLV